MTQVTWILLAWCHQTFNVMWFRADALQTALTKDFFVVIEMEQHWWRWCDCVKGSLWSRHCTALLQLACLQTLILHTAPTMYQLFVNNMSVPQIPAVVVSNGDIEQTYEYWILSEIEQRWLRLFCTSGFVSMDIFMGIPYVGVSVDLWRSKLHTNCMHVNHPKKYSHKNSSEVNRCWAGDIALGLCGLLFTLHVMLDWC